MLSEVPFQLGEVSRPSPPACKPAAVRRPP